VPLQPDDALQYRGKRVVVTGAASGIGEATAVLLADLGADVVGLDRHQPAVPLAQAIHVDLRDDASIAAAAAAIGPPVDALFNCAGLPQTAPGLDVLLAGFVGPRELTERLVPLMSAGGSVVLVSSTVAYRWVDDLATLDELVDTRGFSAAVAWCRAHLGSDAHNYALTKGAVIAYAARRGVELAPSGVRVNCVAPGPTVTPMTAQFRLDEPGHMERIPLPMGRMAEASEQAWALAFLGSPRASFITGTTTFVDGGFVAGLTTGLLTR
jgi:NAD(P)-dependent dehydrogenase (short-subunit alcohol dehydrogenase family)